MSILAPLIPLILCCCYASSSVAVIALRNKIPGIEQYASTVGSVASSSLSLILISIALMIFGMIMSLSKI